MTPIAWATLAVAGGMVLMALVPVVLWRWLDESPHDRSTDPLSEAVTYAWRANDTRTGRVRLLLAVLAEREAAAVGAPMEPRGLHRATP